MSRLLRVELTRFLSRRAILVLLLLGVVLPAIFGIARVIDTTPPPGDQLAKAEQRAEKQAERKVYQRQLADCIADPESMLGTPLPDDIERTCEEVYLPQASWFADYQPLDLVEERESGSGFAVVVVLAILMMLAGTTFAGHDWASGSVSNQLLFEPRRPKVWAAKAVVVAGGTALYSAVVLTLFWLGLGALAGSRDLPVGHGLLLDCLQSGWRGAGVAAAAALAGYALTMLFRSTVAALGVLLATSVAGGIVLAVIGVDSVWNPGLNIAAVVLDGTTYWANVPCDHSEFPGEVCSVERTLPIGRALWFLGTGLVLFAVASLGSFHRRDVP